MTLVVGKPIARIQFDLDRELPFRAWLKPAGGRGVRLAGGTNPGGQG
jgi:hypothetical protein